MATLEKQENPRSVWVKGGFRIGLLVVGLVGIYLGAPQARPYVIGTIWFIVISAVIGVVIAFILRWWNERRPVKAEDEEGIRLGLNDEGPGK